MNIQYYITTSLSCISIDYLAISNIYNILIIYFNIKYFICFI